MEVFLSKNKIPMKNFILFISVILVLLSCKKEKIDVPEIIGKWQFYHFADIRTSSFSPEKFLNFNSYVTSGYYYPFAYDIEKYGEMTLELSEKGEFIFSSYEGTEKFRVVGKERIDIEYLGGILDGWNFELKNKTGQSFEFKLFYDMTNNKLYTVPWIKGTVYNASNAPYSGGDLSIELLGVTLNFGYDSQGENDSYYIHEYLGYFEKL